MRPSRCNEQCDTVNNRAITSYDEIKEGDILQGYVKSTSKVGVFVKLSSNIVGRVQLKNLSQYFVKDYASLFHVGKLVKGKVLSIDPAKNHINLSLRGKDVNDVDPAPPPKRKSTDGNAETPKKMKITTEDQEYAVEEGDLLSEVDESEINPIGESGDSDSEMEESCDLKMQDSTKQNADNSCLELKGYDWSLTEEDDQAQSSDDDEEDGDESKNEKLSSKKSKRQKRADKKLEEESLHKAEMALMDKERAPESADDFERSVIGSPNSSMIWIQFMAFYLHSAEVEKARAVAKRALKSISFREEQEKLNVCVALLNLENSYGTQESLNEAIKEAINMNDAKRIYSKMTEIYCRSNKLQEAEKVYLQMTKQFSQSKEVWVSYTMFLMKNDRLDEARKLMQRCLKSLPRRKHIETIVKMALIECKFGDIGRGTTMFESILKNYPSRTDIWSIYIDQTIKSGDTDLVRNIFERVTSLKLKPKKMRFIFKRYLEFEQKHGTKENIEHVRTSAMDYVHSSLNT
jgi:rRNA biogenesis protein RRP5